MKSANFFIDFLYCTKKRCSQIKPQLKVEIEDGREAPYKPIYYRKIQNWYSHYKSQFKDGNTNLE